MSASAPSRTAPSKRAVDAYEKLRAFVHAGVSDAAVEHGMTFDADESGRQRFYCSNHGWVVPARDRFDCPVCTPYDPVSDGWSYTVTVGGIVSLNAS